MKVLILLALVVASNAAAVVYHPAWWPAASAYQAKDGIGNYVFGHHDAHPGGPSFHSESGDASGRKVGAYGVKDPDGKVRIVEYVADAGGFKANIKTSEKIDKDHQDPAGVTTTEAKKVVAWHPVAYHALPYYFSESEHSDLQASPAINNMKVLILFALFAASQAAVLIGTGASTQYRSQDNHGNYAFGYNEAHPSGATFRKETGSHGVVAGSYGLADADGRQRVVNYVADAAGFRADIKTNEPGVEPKDPANTAINKATLVVAPAAPIAYAAPLPAAIHAPIPAAIHAPHYAAPLLTYAAAPHSAVHVSAGNALGGYSYSTVVGHHGLHHGLHLL
ncbi:pupal cuticle protein Edg-84A [Parasteatoda tepidariorum]|nr:uncharacterized protein LOC107453794 [Parasteatoda tepidariorum]